MDWMATRAQARVGGAGQGAKTAAIRRKSLLFSLLPGAGHGEWFVADCAHRHPGFEECAKRDALRSLGEGGRPDALRLASGSFHYSPSDWATYAFKGAGAKESGAPDGR